MDLSVMFVKDMRSYVYFVFFLFDLSFIYFVVNYVFYIWLAKLRKSCLVKVYFS